MAYWGTAYNDLLRGVLNMSDERTETTSADATAPEAVVIEPLDVAVLHERIAKLERESAEYRDQSLRAMADYKNFKRRADQERADLIRGASAALLLKLLPVMDDLERAMGSVTPEVGASAWYNGFKLIPQKLAAIIESEGVVPIVAVGEQFDPNLHDAVIYEDAEGQEGKVIADLQRGYKLREKILRPTMVKVGKA
jgi:molecular chaperone GrpE